LIEKQLITSQEKKDIQLKKSLDEVRKMEQRRKGKQRNSAMDEEEVNDICITSS
jgi:hypothetical protein